MILVFRLGLYPGGYCVRSTLHSSNSLGDPFIAGPIGPSFDGSLLWQATQFAKYTALPLSKSGSFACAALLESFEQPKTSVKIPINNISPQPFMRCPQVSSVVSCFRVAAQR